MATLSQKLTLKNVAVTFIGGFFLVQIISLLLNQFFPDIPLLRGGQALLLILLGIAVITLFIVGFKVDELSRKENLVFVIIVFALVALAYWKLPEFFPQLFSIDADISNSIKEVMGSIFGG